ncbi:adhesion G protein-coupled receptor L3-like [Sinocyclocheilus grahami]|uniref:adhesion G protein-coupled receptor L3-like n=1 Tax=Sinocyclocheilus grahami TaxID=75366 RepID=UPI0007AD14CE|nr:PREDICTED: adhesion G protein-coupled receptor L3-like [Sinocyclocheilus grahami]
MLRGSVSLFWAQAMVETVNNLLQPQARTAWMELSSRDQLRAATMLLDTVEQGAFVLADNLLKTDIVQENTENIQLEVARMSTDGSLPDLKFPQTGGQGNTIHLSANTLKQHGRNGEIRMAFVLYKHLGSYLSTENASMKFSSETLNTNYSVIVNSPVITAAINKDSNKVYLSDPVIFTMRHIQQSEENFNPNCSFWSYSKRSMTGFWSTQDCRLLGTNRTHTTCSCTHLTNFAVLMAHVDVKANRMCLMCSSTPAEFFLRLLSKESEVCGSILTGECCVVDTAATAAAALMDASSAGVMLSLGTMSDNRHPSILKEAAGRHGYLTLSSQSLRLLRKESEVCGSILTGECCVVDTAATAAAALMDALSAGVMLSLGTMSDNRHPSILKEAAGRHGYLTLPSQRSADIRSSRLKVSWDVSHISCALLPWLCGLRRDPTEGVQWESVTCQRDLSALTEIACAVFAALLHFFFLSAFTWMFLEGVQLYIMLVEVFESEHSRRRYFYLAGYGIPALIVAVSAAVDYHSYGTDRVCWLRLDTYFIWSFIGPATFIIMLNVIFLGIALYKMFHHTAILKPDSGCLDNIKSWVIGAIALLCLLGLTWAFGLMYVNESTVIMAYLFTIFNSLQGMFIFIFHCVLQQTWPSQHKRLCERSACMLNAFALASTSVSSSRGPGRYSSASQSRIRRMWNDTVRKQSESSFMAGDINSSATLNRGAMANHLIPNSLLRAHASNNPYNTLLGESAVYNNPTLSMYNAQEGILNNARDTSAMDTLPLNGNHGNSYSLASADYMSDCVQIIDRTYNVHKETTLEKRILKELTSNYLPTYLNNHDRTAEHGRNLMNKLVNEVSNGGGVKDSPMLPVNLALGLDDSASFPHEDSLGLELIREESNTPLLPPPRHVQPLPSTFSSASSSRRRLPQENSESFFPLLTEEQTEETPSPQRDSLYTSMPTLPDPERSDTHSLPRGGDTHMLPRSGEPDDVYYKSMPNLGSRNHLHQLHSYYQLGRGSSDGFIVPPKDELSPEETPPQETAHMTPACR